MWTKKSKENYQNCRKYGDAENVFKFRCLKWHCLHSDLFAGLLSRSQFDIFYRSTWLHDLYGPYLIITGKTGKHRENKSLTILTRSDPFYYFRVPPSWIPALSIIWCWSTESTNSPKVYQMRCHLWSHSINFTWLLLNSKQTYWKLKQWNTLLHI